MARLIENETFRYGDDFLFNACVGKNGRNGFYEYEVGYDEGIKKLLEAALLDFSDALIYPIAFMARHRIELFLKKHIRNMAFCNSFISSKKDNHLEAQGIHNLKLLWDRLESLCKIDKRIEEKMNVIKPFVHDYFSVDPTGQTFRYPFNLEGEHHLDAVLYHINLVHFQERYLEMSSEMEDMNFIVDLVVYEYQQGTFTNKLSRSDIERISLELSPCCEWKKSNFDAIRNDLKKKYNLSSQQLSKAIDIIKKHKEFSCNIGIINRVEEIDENEVSEILSYYGEYEKNISTTPHKWLDIKEAIVNKITNKINKDAIFAWLAFKEIGYYSYVYSEEYEKLIECFRKKDETNFFIKCNLFASGNELNYVRRGMGKCGQRHLLELF